MIDYICSAQWTPYGIMCPDVHTARVVHRFLREAVMDRHIYISKIIGFSFDNNDLTRVGNGEYITRHQQIGESYSELIVVLGNKVFLDPFASSYTVSLTTGVNTLYGDSVFKNTLNQEAEVVFTDPTVCTCLKGTNTMHVLTIYDCTYRDTARNSFVIKSLAKKNNQKRGNFFPCFTDHCLNDFVRILPMMNGDTLVPVRFYNGMTQVQFQKILSNWNSIVKSGNIRNEEKLWLQNFRRLQRTI